MKHNLLVTNNKENCVKYLMLINENLRENINIVKPNELNLFDKDLCNNYNILVIDFQNVSYIPFFEYILEGKNINQKIYIINKFDSNDKFLSNWDSLYLSKYLSELKKNNNEIFFLQGNKIEKLIWGYNLYGFEPMENI